MTRILITSALPYINGVKHLGNLVGSMLPADVYARFKRAQGHEVLYICATDEHGTPAELAALEAGQGVAEYCREQHQLQKEIGERFGLSWDYFGRSSSPQNHKLTQHFCQKLDEAGLIEERVDKQVYSIDDGRFLPDRYITGTCPNCGYERARGDQCENCTRLLDPTDLIEPRSSVSGSTNLEVRASKHLYLRQSQMVDEIRSWIEGQKEWPILVTSIAKKWLDEGLRDRCITRDLDWGIPVNRPGFEDKVFYVWFDAPIEYIAATQEWADDDTMAVLQNLLIPGGDPLDGTYREVVGIEGTIDFSESGIAPARDWRSWWYGDAAKDVTYVQFMGKDNIPFHTVGFPITLIGSKEPWKTADFIKGFNYLNFQGGQFSTSQGRGIFMDQALEILPADYWRYYLMANAPESSDSSFTWEHFASTVNKDLADVLGNFVNRILRFTKSRFGEEIPAGGEPDEAEARLQTELDQRIGAYTTHLEAMEFRKAFSELRAIWAAGNEYLTVAEPWSKFKQDKDQAAIGVRTGFNLIRLYAILSHPVIPTVSEKLLGCLNLGREELAWPDQSASTLLSALQPGHSFTVPDVLIQKITDEQIEDWTARFGGAETQ